jgi:hypothetical protein
MLVARVVGRLRVQYKGKRVERGIRVSYKQSLKGVAKPTGKWLAQSRKKKREVLVGFLEVFSTSSVMLSLMAAWQLKVNYK